MTRLALKHANLGEALQRVQKQEGGLLVREVLVEWTAHQSLIAGICKRVAWRELDP